jgi:hypothetical protein
VKYHCHQLKPSLKLLKIKRASDLADLIEQKIQNGSDFQRIKDDFIEFISILKQVTLDINNRLINKL